MSLDVAKNFSKVTVSTGYDGSATTVVLSASEGAKLPTVPFNAVWFNSTDYTDPTDDPNKEIIRVTNIATDTLTVTRAQESTSAATHNTGGKSYKMIAGLTAKVINTDIPAMNVASATVAFGCTLDTDGTLAANSDTKIPSQKAVKTYADTRLPAGIISPYSGSTAPSGYLLCNGATVSQTTYAALFAITGHTYGADPGDGNFILPNLKGKVIVGVNASETEFDVLGETGGEKKHALIEAELAEHTHTLPPGRATDNFNDGGAYVARGYTNSANNPTSPGATCVPSLTGSGTAHNNLQPYISLNYIIKT